MQFLKVGAALVALVVSSAAMAADMPVKAKPSLFSPKPMSSGFYLEFFGGYVSPSVDPATDRNCSSAAPLALIPCGTTADLNPDDGWRIGGGVGYKFNQFFRADFTLSHTEFSGSGLDIPAATVRGGADFESLTGLFTGYLNLAPLAPRNAFGPFQPYVGAGIGFSRNKISNVNGVFLPAPATTIVLPGGATTEFAWTVVAGAGLSLAWLGMPKATFDMRYRYIDHGKAVTDAGTQTILVGGVPVATLARTGIQTNVETHAAEFGIRWDL